MKTFLFLALAGFVLAVSLAVPFTEDDLESQENELKCPYDQILDIHFFTFLYTIGLA